MQKENYALVDLLHLSFIIRDSLEYCHDPLEIKENAFEQRTKFYKNLLEKEHFIAKFLVNNPNENGKKYYDDLLKYFENIYDKEFYVLYHNHKVEPDKKLEFLEETVKNFQVVNDIMNGFVEMNKKNNVLNDSVYECIVSNENFFRVIFTLILFNEIVKEDQNYKTTLQQTRNPESYENKYILNLLRGYMGAYHFNKERYRYDEKEIKDLFDEVFSVFQKLDGSIKVSSDEEIKLAKDRALYRISQAIRTYENKWRDAYKKLLDEMKNDSNNNKPA